MPKEKKIVVGLELQDKDFLKGLSEINKNVQDIGKTVQKMVTETGGNFATLSTKVDQTNSAISRGNSTMLTMVNVLKEIRGHLADLKNSAGTTNTALDSLNKTAGRTETGVKQIKDAVDQVNTGVKQFGTSVNQTVTSTNQLANANMQAAQSFNALGQAAQTSASTGLQNVQSAYDRLKTHSRNAFGAISDTGLGGLTDLFSPTRIAKAAGWNMAYKIADAPMRAFQAIATGADQAIKSSSQLEGTMFDLQAYLGGAAQDEFQKLAKEMGKTGSDEQLNDAGMQALQNKILSIGQKTTFTANQIADATVQAAKAGISLKEIAGEGGTALDAISYLSQNTGESLENSATQVAKLQALFESNLARSQVAMGKAVDAGGQYQIIVDGLATADMSSAASAQQLTEALFNVGGSASNLNISFFETMSLVSQMVPAFESAASAGTSLKYVFSGISGGRSVKAKGAMQRFGLMDEAGQSVFFGKNEKTGKTEFKGIEYMSEKLREVFGEKSGMAVDVRNRVITDIFGQDALKAVSRMVSMTDEQAQEMYKMAADMTSNAAAGVQSAAELAQIKNEGLEYDIEYLKGTLDALQTNLTMPLMKPMSNFVKTFSSIGDAAFLVLTDAEDASEKIKTIKTEFLSTSLLPGAEALMDSAVKFARTLSGVLKVITTEGYSISSVSKAIATLFGGSANEMNARAAEFESLLKRTYAGMEKFVKALPSLLEKIAKYSLIAFDGLIRGITWISENWETVVKGIQAVFAALVVSKVITFTSEIVNMGNALFDMARNAQAAGGWLQSIANVNTGNAGGVTSLVQGVAGRLSGGGAATAAVQAAGGASTAAQATAAAAAQIPLMTRLIGLWGTFSAAIGSAWTAITTTAGWATIGQTIIGALTSTFALVAAAVVVIIAALVVTWNNNIGNFATFTKERFNSMTVYFSDFINLWSYQWNRLVNTFTWVGTQLSTFWNWLNQSAQGTGALEGFAQFAKGVVQILENLLLLISGIGKLLAGAITLDYHVFFEGLAEMGISLAGMLGGLLRTFVGTIDGMVKPLIDMINFVAEKTQLFEKIPSVSAMLEGSLSLLDFGFETANNLDKGYRNGFKGATKGTKSAVKSYLTESIVETTDDLFVISSPSRWAYEKARMIGAGFADGFTDVAPKVAAAMASMLHMSMDETIKSNFAESAKIFTEKQFEIQKQNAKNSQEAKNNLTKNLGVKAASNLGYDEVSYIAQAYLKDKGVGANYKDRQINWKDEQQFAPAFVGTTTNYGPQSVGYNPYANKVGIPSTGFTNAENMPATAYETRAVQTLLMSKEFLEYAQKLNTTNKPIDEAFVMNMLRNQTGSIWGPEIGSKDKVSSVLNSISRNMGYGDFENFKQSSEFRSSEYLREQNLQRTVPLSREQLVESITPVFAKVAGRYGETLTPTRFMTKQQKYIRDTAGYSEQAAVVLQDMNKAAEAKGVYFGQSAGLYAGATEYRLSSTQLKNAYGQEIGQFDKKVGAFVTSLEDYNKNIGQYIKSNGAMIAASLGATRSAIVAYNANLTPVKGDGPQQNADDITRYTQGAANLSGRVGQGIVTDITPDPRYSLPSGLAFESAGGGGYWRVGATQYGKITTEYEARDLTPEEMNARNKPLDFVPVTQLPQMGSFFTDSIIPESYDGPNGMVSPDIAAYKQLYGEAGIKYHGLTKLFEDTPALANQYAQVGNRAATFLSMKQGKLTAADYKTFQELLALDQKDKNNFLAASKTLAAEQNKINSDPTLTQEQKNTKIARLQSDFTYNNRAMAGSFRDVLGVKVGGLADYDTAVSEGKISEQAKPYTDTAFQRVREAYANALDPKNQSEAFKKLSPEEQDRIKKAAMELPLQTQAYYNSAIADGVISDTERQLLEQYSGSDAAAVAKLIADATLPTQDQLNAAYQPYIDGTATVTAASNITGVVAPTWLSGLANIVNATAVLHGQEYANAFIQGIATDPEGNKIGLASVTVVDALSADPATIKENGVKAGESLPEGIWQGIANGTKVLAYKVTKYFGPPNSDGERPLIRVVREAIKAKSPSALYRDLVGLPIIEGVAKGITDNKYLVEKALKDAVGIGSGTIAAGQQAGSGINDPEAGAPTEDKTKVSPYFLMGQSASKDFIRGFVNAEDPINAFSVALMTAISKPFNPQSQESPILDMFTKVTDFGKKIGRVLIDDGFTQVIDGKTEEPWTFATVIGVALAHTAGDEEGKWKPQAYSVGRNIALGIADGIADSVAVQKIKDNAVKAVEDALIAAQKRADMGSPSRLFAREIGSPITAGIAQGITESSYMLDSAMGGLMDGATRNYRPDISPVALAGQRQAQINAQNTYNYNLGVHTSQNPQLVQRSFAVMKSFEGES